MRSLDIPTVTSNLDCLERIQAQIEEMNSQLLGEFKRRPDAQLIATIPGIGYYGALLIHAEIDDINRFPNPERLAAYAGLVPTVSQSASTVHYGGISKEGSAYLRWVLTEAVHSHKYLHAGSNLAKFHSRIEKRRGKNKATIATARKLVHIIYWMLRTREPYHSQGFNPVTKPARTNA
jgi:transposase